MRYGFRVTSRPSRLSRSKITNAAGTSPVAVKHPLTETREIRLVIAAERDELPVQYATTGSSPRN
jgi:hypothetical protein